MTVICATTALLALIPLSAIAFYAVSTAVAERKAAAFRKLNPQIPVYSQWISYTSVAVRFGLVPDFLIRFKANWAWQEKFKPFEDSEIGAFAIVSPSGITVHVAQADLIREVTTKFPKPLHYYKLLNIFGKNVVTVEGDEWKRHRRITGPQFSEKNNRLVHSTTVATVSDMMSSWDQNFAVSEGEKKPSNEIEVGQDMTKLALLVISGAGFGLPLNWEGEDDLKELLGDNAKKHTMSYKESLGIVVEYLTLYLILPTFIYKFPSATLSKIKNGFHEFESYMSEFVKASRESAKAGKSSSGNLLSSLVAASASAVSEEQKQGLSESELLGNIFILLFAGHETTAGTLTYALALMAIHQDQQERLHDEVVSVFGESSYPTYEDYGRLLYCQAAMTEVLRLYPAVVQIPKWTNDKHTTLGPLNLEPGTYLDITVPALHHNPKHWGADHDTFRPDRFLPSATNKPERYAFASFSEGGRMCLGKKFSQVEFVCALAMISKRYTWKLAKGVTAEDVLKSTQVITMRPSLPTLLTFTRRDDCGALPSKRQAEDSGDDVRT